MVSQNSDKCGGHKHCGSGDIIVLVFHMISRDHITKGSCKTMGRSLYLPLLFVSKAHGISY